MVDASSGRVLTAEFGEELMTHIAKLNGRILAMQRFIQATMNAVCRDRGSTELVDGLWLEMMERIAAYRENGEVSPAMAQGMEEAMEFLVPEPEGG